MLDLVGALKQNRLAEHMEVYNRYFWGRNDEYPLYLFIL